MLHFGHLRPLRLVEASLAFVGRSGTFRADKARSKTWTGRDRFGTGTVKELLLRSEEIRLRELQKLGVGMARVSETPSSATLGVLILGLDPPSGCDGPPPHRAVDVRNRLKEARIAIPVWIQELRDFPPGVSEVDMHAHRQRADLAHWIASI